MTYKPCPDCENGWRYSDEMPDWHCHASGVSLVKCPTCGGTGRIVLPEGPYLALHEHASAEPRTAKLPAPLIRYEF